MPRVEAFSVPGVVLFFNSLDHLPEHFHALRPGEWETRVYFLLCGSTLVHKLKWSAKKGGVPASFAHALNAAIRANRAELLREWEAKVAQPAPEEDDD